jgi:hypothetical protein
MFDFASAPRLARRWRTTCFDNLNRLDWVCSFSVICFGVRIAVRANDPTLLEKLRARLPADAKAYRGSVVDHYFSAILGGPVEGSRARRFHLLYHNHSQLYRGGDLDRLLREYDSIFRLAVAALAPRRVFVHAGVVGWNGHAILMPGRTLSGKTTLTAALVRAGASYFSDEYAVLDDEGRVHPFRKPLSLRTSPGSPQIDTPVEAIGGRAAKHPLPVGLVLVSSYKEGANWKPRTLTPGRGMLALLDNTVNALHVPERCISSIQKVVTQAPVVKTSRGECAAVVPRLLRMLERRCRR